MRSVNLDGSVVKTKAGCRNVGAAVSWQNEVKGIRLRQCRIDSSRADIAAVKSRDVDNVHGGLFYAQLFSLSLCFRVKGHTSRSRHVQVLAERGPHQGRVAARLHRM